MDRLTGVGPFDESLDRNSDYEFNWRLRSEGELLLFDPTIRSIYRPRPSLRALGRQFWWYGRWKERVVRRHPGSLRPRQLVAPSMVAAVAAAPMLATFRARSAAARRGRLGLRGPRDRRRRCLPRHGRRHRPDRARRQLPDHAPGLGRGLPGLARRGRRLWGPFVTEPAVVEAGERNAGTRTTGVAVVGYGYWGANLARNVASAASLRLVGVADPDEAQRKQATSALPGIRSWLSLDEVLDDLEVGAVILAVPAHMHGDMARQVLASGRHVLVEKPLATDPRAADDIVALADERELIAMVGHTFLYSPPVLRLREYIAAGELGEVQYLYSQRLSLGRIRRDCNALWNFAPHDISIMLHLLDERPVEVSGQGLLVHRARHRRRVLRQPDLPVGRRGEPARQLDRSAQDPPDDRRRRRQDGDLQRRLGRPEAVARRRGGRPGTGVRGVRVAGRLPVADPGRRHRHPAHRHDASPSPTRWRPSARRARPATRRSPTPATAPDVVKVLAAIDASARVGGAPVAVVP